MEFVISGRRAAIIASGNKEEKKEGEKTWSKKQLSAQRFRVKKAIS